MRAVIPADAALLAVLHLDAYRGGRTDWDEAFFNRILALPTTRGLLHGQEKGFILWQHMQDFGEVITLAVTAAAQGQGIGRQLLDAYEAALQADAVPHSILDVAEDNMPARKLYERAGYTQINRRGDYYRIYRDGREQRLDALVLQKVLVQP